MPTRDEIIAEMKRRGLAVPEEDASPSEEEIRADEILHVRTDYRSHWFIDNEERYTYGLWGALGSRAAKEVIEEQLNQ